MDDLQLRRFERDAQEVQFYVKIAPNSPIMDIGICAPEWVTKEDLLLVLNTIREGLEDEPA